MRSYTIVDSTANKQPEYWYHAATVGDDNYTVQLCSSSPVGGDANIMIIPISLKKYTQSSVNSSLVYQNFSHNMPIYGELGRYPLSITIKQGMVCYWTRILKSNQHKLNKVMYDILYNLHCKDIHSSGWIIY